MKAQVDLIPRFLIGPCLVVLLALPPAIAEPPTPALTQQQQERLKERDRLDKEADKLQEQGKLTETIANVEKILAIDREVHGPEHDSVAETLRWLANLHADQEDFAAARKAAQERVALCEKQYGTKHWKVTNARLDLAHLEKRAGMSHEDRQRVTEADRLMGQVRTLYGQGKYREALEPCRHILDIRKELLGENHPHYAVALSWLAMVEQELGEYDQAEALYRQYLGLEKRLFGEDHPNYAKALNLLAWFYQTVEKYPQAEPLFRQALEIERKVLGEKDPLYANTLNNLARLYRQMGDYKRAEPLLQQALEIRKQVLGEKDLEYSDSLNDLADLYKDQGLYGKAEPLYQQAADIKKQILGEKHPRYALALNNLATDYWSIENYARAEELFRQALAIDKQAAGENHPDYATDLDNLSVLYQDMGDFARAERLSLQSLEIRKRVLGEKSPAYAIGLSNLAGLYQRKKDYARAEPLCRQALAIRKEVLGEKHPDSMGSLHDLAGLYDELDDPDRAEPLFRQALALRKEVLGEHHPQTLNSLRGLIGTLCGIGAKALERDDLLGARRAWQEVVDLRSGLFGEKHWMTADARRELELIGQLDHLSKKTRQQLLEADRMQKQAEDLAEKYQLRNAIPLAEKVLKTQQQALGEGHWKCAETLHLLGYLYEHTEELAKAERADQQALAIRKQVLGEENPAYLDSLHNLAGLSEARGEFARGEQLGREEADLRKKVQGEKSEAYAGALNNLAEAYSSLGQDNRCEAMYRKVLKIRKETLGENDPHYALGLLNLGKFYKNLGDYAKAEPLYQQAAAVYKNALGDHHPDYARSLDYLGTLYEKMGDYSRAEPLYQQALAIRKQALGEQSRDYGITLNNLGLLYLDMREYAKAEPPYQQALAIGKQLLGEQHPDYAISLSNLAELYDAMGEHDKAEPLYRQALAINEKQFGKEKPKYSSSLHMLALHYAAMKDWGKAEPLEREAVLGMRHYFDQTSTTLSEHEQLTFRKQVRSELNLYLTVTAELKTPAKEIYPDILAWKAPVATRQLYTRRLRRSLKENGSSETARLFGELEEATRVLSNRSHATPDPKDPDALREDLEKLSDKIESMQQALAAASADFRKTLEEEQLTAEDIGKILPDNGVLVDYVEYGHFLPIEKRKKPSEWPIYLAAFVVHKDRPVERIELGPAEPITQAIDRWRLHYGRRAGDQDPGAALRRLLWAPLPAWVQASPMVLISPSGALARLPFAALPGRQPGSYLIEDQGVAVVPVPKLLPELLEKAPTASPEPSLLLVGDVNFDAAPGLSGNDTLALAAPHAQRSGTPMQWPRLPGTTVEADAVKAAFQKRYPRATVTDLRGESPTETAIRQQGPQHKYLHLATHGYFAPPGLHSAMATGSSGDKADLQVRRKDVISFHPGLLSGLVLAGANQPVDLDRDDGILTALEVGALDLSGVDLVTLSACETGLGEYAGGEGLLGLQRSLQTAGARSVVSSLWKVSDSGTQLLMQRFYDNLWQKQMPKLEALRQAQLWMLREGARQKDLSRGLEVLPEQADVDQEGTLPPYYWAAFVLSGDWR